jgi:hypothetical protein
LAEHQGGQQATKTPSASVAHAQNIEKIETAIKELSTEVPMLLRRIGRKS